jgi:polyhydroxyalkanoate synthesis regulator protein
MKKLIKRYARTRLYDTQEARYVTISELREWEVNDLEFVVIDADTGDDITQVLLA